MKAYLKDIKPGMVVRLGKAHPFRTLVKMERVARPYKALSGNDILDWHLTYECGHIDIIRTNIKMEIQG